MKLIDLLNKIANGDEDIPKRFDFAGGEFNLNNYGEYRDEDGDNLFNSCCTDFSNINDEIEIIEEDKKTEKLMRLDSRETSDCIIKIQDKINELIEEVNKLKKVGSE